MSEKRFVMALDQGTTSSRAILFDASGRAGATDQYEFEQHFPKPGWGEHDANRVTSVASAARFFFDRSGETREHLRVVHRISFCEDDAL